MAKQACLEPKATKGEHRNIQKSYLSAKEASRASHSSYGDMNQVREKKKMTRNGDKAYRI